VSGLDDLLGYRQRLDFGESAVGNSANPGSSGSYKIIQELNVSAKPNKSVSPETNVRHKITWWRVPLALTAALLVTAFIHKPGAFWRGVPVAFFGELIQLWAASHLHKDKKFTISGPYAYVRNPMYVGRFFLLLGFFIMTGNLFLIVAYVALFAGYAQARVRREENRLQRIFEPHYQRYCAEVHRWLPRLRPYSHADGRRASWAQVCFNGEQLILLGMIVVLAMVYLRIEDLPIFFFALACVGIVLLILAITRVTTKGKIELKS
jgi:protein-S-isoprenylcysteine O-methyltransferase Ste14